MIKSLNERATIYGVAIDLPATNRKERRNELKVIIRGERKEKRKEKRMVS